MVLVVGYLNIRSAGAPGLSLGPDTARSHQSPVSVSSSAPCVTCPLCGAKNPISDHLFNSERYNWQTGSINLEDSRELIDTKIAERLDCPPAPQNQDLDGIKRRVILRCAEIIQKLTI